jgi:hypothetical protein
MHVQAVLLPGVARSGIADNPDFAAKQQFCILDSCQFWLLASSCFSCHFHLTAKVTVSDRFKKLGGC